LGGNWTVWRKEINYFNKKGYSTLALDLRGHGKSNAPQKRKQYNLECFAKDLNAVLKKVKIKKVVLIGHSLGGIVALTFYNLFKSKVKAIVLCSSTSRSVLEYKLVKKFYPFIRIFIKNLYFALNKLLEFFEIKNKRYENPIDVNLSKYKNFPDPYIFFIGWLHKVPIYSILMSLDCMVKFTTTKMLKKIKMPVLLIEGKKDKLLPPIYSYNMFTKIKDVELDFIPNAKHFLPIDNSRKVDGYIYSFLKKLE